MKTAKITVVLCLVFCCLCIPEVTLAEEDDAFDHVVFDDLIYPIKMTTSGNSEYVFDQGNLLVVRNGKSTKLANLTDIYSELRQSYIRKDDLKSFRPTQLLVDNDDIYVSGVIARNWGVHGEAALYYLILQYKEGKLNLLKLGRGQDSLSATASDWEEDADTGLIFYNGVYLYDYMTRDWTQPAMAIVNNHLYYVHSVYNPNSFNKEALNRIDLATGDEKTLIDGVGFDYLSGAYTRGDYWQGNGKSYTIIPASNEKTITIIDGHENIYSYDVIRKKLTREAHFYEFNKKDPGDQNFMFLSGGKVYKGREFYLNANGIYRQDKLTERPQLIFIPEQFKWETNGPGYITDWSIIDDHSIELLEYDSHRIVKLDIDLFGKY